MVRRIREMLRFEAEPVPLVVHLPVLAVDRAIQEIARIKLNPRFGRQHLQHAAAGWVESLRGQDGMAVR